MHCKKIDCTPDSISIRPDANDAANDGMFMGGLTSSMAISHSPPSEQHAPGSPVPPSPPTGLKHPANNDLLPKNINIEV